jgi:hypothetical protein
MKSKNGEFETVINNHFLEIFITQESDCSSDGGHTFETITNNYELNKFEATKLINELSEYLMNLDPCS